MKCSRDREQKARDIALILFSIIIGGMATVAFGLAGYELGGWLGAILAPLSIPTFFVFLLWLMGDISFCDKK